VRRYVLQPEQQTLETDGIECRAYFWAARGDLGGYLAGGFGMPQEPDNEGEDLGSANEVPAGWVDDDGMINNIRRTSLKKMLPTFHSSQ